MVDLYNQYLKIKNEIDEAIFDVIKKSSFVKGEEVKKFEEKLAEYLNVKHVISCGNGTDALQIALMALDLEEGDEVITPNFTFISTVEVILLLKLKPILIDIDKKNFLIDTNKIKEKITKRTKVIMPVHLFGQAANMEEILRIAKEHNLYVIEDTAQALGTNVFVNGEWQKAGTIGDIGCTSFFPTKNLGCFGDGGAIFTNNDKLANKIRAIANHGMLKRYYHEYIGVNSRLDSIQANILSVKLKYLNDFIKKRQETAAKYNQLLSNISYIEIPTTVDWSTHTYHQYCIIVKNDLRDALKEYLEKNNIPTMVYYPLPIHQQPAYKFLAFNDNELINSICISKSILALPMHTELTNEQIHFIVDKIKEFFELYAN